MTKFIYSGPINGRENFADLVQCWAAEKAPPATWPEEPWERQSRRVPLREFLTGWGGDLLPGIYRELVEELTGQPRVHTYGLAADALRRLL